MARRLSRRSFVRTAALGSAGLALAPKIYSQPAKLPRKPNLLVFLPDQQRADTLACYGSANVHAPNLNKFAAQSVIFEQAYVTHPVCTPSRSSLMTGTWPHTNGCTHNFMRLDPRFRCLPELISDADYRCGWMGKWHLGDEPFAQHGFEEWVSIEDGPPFRADFSPGRDPKTISDYSKFLFAKGLKPNNGQDYFDSRFATTLSLDLSKPKFLETKACEFLDRHKNEPFVLFIAFLEPHPPYNGPLNNEHPLDQISVATDAGQTFGAEMPLRYRLRQESDRKKFGTPPEKYRKTKQKYLGLVTEMDQSIGAILTKLEALSLADSTIVVHTSDHGDMMTAHGLVGKEVMFQEATRVPYLVRLPNQRRSFSVPQPISHIDFAPTIVDLLGKPPHEQCAGKSRAPLIRGEAMPPETIFMEWAPGKKPKVDKHTKLGKPDEIKHALSESTRTAISPDGWKLCLRDNDKSELYSLQADRREEQNLFGRSEQKDVIAKLTEEIHRWQASVKDSVKV
ncbi:MAG: arylsulfatase [Verrucomicrobiota bacterium]|jgi:arylsulfatase A-like enzyme